MYQRHSKLTKLNASMALWFRKKLKIINNKFFTHKYPKTNALIKEEAVGMNGGSKFISGLDKSKIDNVEQTKTFYLKHKKLGRTIVVKGSYVEVLNKYGNEFDFQKPMIENINDEWDESGNIVHMDTSA